MKVFKLLISKLNKRFRLTKGSGYFGLQGPLGETRWSFSTDSDRPLYHRSPTITSMKHLNRSIQGVCHGYFLELHLRGVGFRSWVEDEQNALCLDLGFNHYISIIINTQVSILCKKTKIFLFSFDLGLLHNLGRRIKNIRLPDVYRSKGILYTNENVKKKVGKQR